MRALVDDGAAAAAVGLLQVQAAAQAWAVLASRALGTAAAAAGGKRRDVEEVVAALEAERAFVSAAFQLLPSSTVEDEGDAAVAAATGGGGEGQADSPVTRVRRQLRAMGRRAAVGRAQAESLLARLFLRQCAVADALQRLEGGGGGEEEEEGLEAVVAGLVMAHDEEEEGDTALDALLRAVGVNSLAEAAALEAALCGRGDGDDEEEEGWAPPSSSSLLEEEEEECSSGGRMEEIRVLPPSSQPSEPLAAVVYDTGGSVGGDIEGSPTTSVEGEDVLEVFEGTAAVAVAGADSPGRRRWRSWRPPEEEKEEEREEEEEQLCGLEQGALLLGELGRVLKGRERQRRGAAVKVSIWWRCVAGWWIDRPID